MEVFIIVSVFSAVVLLLYFSFTYKTKEEKEYEEKIEKSLADEFIIDPETGTRLTLEQAESGHWIAHDNEFRIIPNSELDKLPLEEYRQVETALNHLRGSRSYKKIKLSNEQLKVLEETITLKNYDDWTYSDPFEFEKGIVFLPAPELRGTTYYQDDYKESHLMFWIKINNINGHYFLREKTSSEKLLDLIKDDDELKLDNYECFTVKQSHSIIVINKILEYFENEKGLEIEFSYDNLFIKTTKLISLEDINRIERIIENIR